uniref:Uncharacterized protein n=1 Tax=Kalanchoe fedtschenkoi TaxID=63787 RepID=A0A7N0TA21_KALFE
MKFGKELASQLVPEWQDAYMDYNSLKQLLKQVLSLRQQAAPPAAVAATPRGTLRRRVSLYRAFSGLTGRNRGATAADDDQVILVSAAAGNNEDYQTTFLNSPGQSGAEFEAAFFGKLDAEFNKVVKFYKAKVEYVLKEAEELSKQMDALIALRIKVDDPSILTVAANGDSSAPSISLFVNDNRKSGWVQMDVIKESDGSDEDIRKNESHCIAEKDNRKLKAPAFRPAPLDVLNHVTVNVAPETPISTLKGIARLSDPNLAFSKKELQKAEHRLTQAFIEFHKLLRILKSYSFLNILAFSKILKKYDKITSRNASKAYMNMVENSCLASDEVNKLLQRVEATFVKHFFNGNHKKGMRSLRPQLKKERHQTTFFLGLFTGCSIALVAAIGVAIHLGQLLVDQTGRDVYMSTLFPLYSLFLFIVLHMAMYAVDIYYWKRFRVNYSFIFGFKQGTELGYTQVLLAGSILMVLALAAVLSNLEMKADSGTRSYDLVTELVPLGLLVVVALVMFCPFNVIYRSSRFFLITCAFRCVMAPLYKVTLPDFFLADQLTSQVQAFRSLQFYVCYYGWGDFTRREHKCELSQSKVFEVFFFAVAVIPYWFRFLQCLRRLFEEKSGTEGLNALKYLSTIVAVLFRTANERYAGRFTLRIIVWTTSVVATVFNTYWDIVKDWGLLQRNSKNPWLRDKLLIPDKSVYFVAIIVNVILRLAWMQTVMGYREAPFLHRTAMVALVACLEIIRRGIWNFFRLENEHLNNVGKFRAFKSVPLPFNYDDEEGNAR